MCLQIALTLLTKNYNQILKLYYMYIKITSKITIKLETITIRIYTFNLSLY